jgi:Protein of unknown function (DUF3365)
MSRTSFLTAVIAFASIAGSNAQSPPPVTSWPISEAPPALRVVISRADLIVVSMQDALVRELREGLERGGPASALRSCHVDATGVSQRVARGENIAAGRTSDRLRNPTNAPRPWAAALVQANAGRRARDVEGFAVDLGDRVGVLRPIALRPMCAGCHGPADKVSPAVRRLLADQYPADKATGFTEGEIRGWFWVEMPKPR